MKKRTLRIPLALLLACGMLISLSACNRQEISETLTGQARASDEKNSAKADTSDSQKAEKDAQTNSDSASFDPDTVFTARDLEQTADLDGAVTLTVKDGETLSVTKAGTYLINGTAKECTIRVEAGNEAKVQLVLDGVSVTNTAFPVIYVVSADKCFITLTDSDNTLTVTGTFRADGETNTDAVIYAKDDLVLNGSGSLYVTSKSGNGISCKDDLKITGGTYTMNTALDSFEANDSLSICDGTFSVTAKKDAFHCENDDDNTLGSVYISGGTFTVNAESDAIQATTTLQIDGGTFDLKGREGLEATRIVINDGNITINASDDGINASKKSTAAGTPSVTINGGNLNVTVGQGDTDAIDANGDIYVNGGTINITSTVSSFDYDGKAEYNGGTIIINGETVDSIPKSMMGGPGGFGGGGKPNRGNSDGNGNGSGRTKRNR